MDGDKLLLRSISDSHCSVGVGDSWTIVFLLIQGSLNFRFLEPGGLLLEHAMVPFRLDEDNIGVVDGWSERAGVYRAPLDVRDIRRKKGNRMKNDLVAEKDAPTSAMLFDNM